jgi:hypothetical protein
MSDALKAMGNPPEDAVALVGIHYPSSIIQGICFFHGDRKWEGAEEKIEELEQDEKYKGWHWHVLPIYREE